MRFVHVADVHLDTSFAGRSDAVRKRLRAASRQAFRNAVDLALNEDVDAFLIAGDLFDSERLSFETERYLIDSARRLQAKRITLVYAAGNHDPGGESGPRSLDWPDNVKVAADGVPVRVAVPGRSGEPCGFVTAVGHATPSEREDLSRRLPRPDGHLPEVALLHTQVHASEGSGAHHAYAPSELSYLVRSGYDYWALGHVHVRQSLSADPPIHYPGNLQGRTHADGGPRGALLVDLTDRSAPKVEFHDLAPVRWETLRVDGLEAADSLDRLERRIREAWKSVRASSPSGRDTEWMIRVVLDGATPLWRELRREEDRDVLGRELAHHLEALDVVVVADRVHPVVDVEDYRRRTDALGAALRLARSVRLGNARLATLRADDLAGTPGEDAAAVDRYVRTLLDGVDGELVARFLSAEAAE